MIRSIPALLASAALLAAAIGTPALAASQGHKKDSIPGLLQADGGSGYAMSLKPGANPAAGVALYAIPPGGGAWRFEQNVDSSQCNNGKVETSPPCPWTGSAANLDTRYAGHPIYSYVLVAAPGLCAAATDITSTPDVMLLGQCIYGFQTRTDQEWVPEDNAGQTSGAILNVDMTQIAAGRRVMCDNGQHNPMNTTRTGDCSNGHQDWVFNRGASAGR